MNTNTKNFFKNKSILITGGTGSFGKQLISYFLKNKFPFLKIIVFSRDEFKQFELSKIFPEEKFPCMRYFIGDVRDKDRLMLALQGVDYVIHAAALKQVPIAEYNPFEAIKTNIIGSQNLIEACLGNRVKKVIALSTDKAAAPLNLYGATKLCSEKLFIAANNIIGKRDLTFSVVRYGNVLGSRGSVIPEFLKQKETGMLFITDKEMTRFSITLDESVNFVLFALVSSIGGEIFVPKISSFRIIDLAQVISPNGKIKFTGIRSGEKIYEELITIPESLNTLESKNFYLILPSLDKKFSSLAKKLKKNFKSFSYNSSNCSILEKNQIKSLLIKNKFI
jgi:UDP-N-acetylglucosamine 4,6-dehydratase (inverting)